jgi:hypothetical protein
MNDKMERIWKEAVMVTIMAYVWKEENHKKTPVKIAGVLIKICTKLLQNKSPEHYCYTSVLCQMNYCYNCVFTCRK